MELAIQLAAPDEAAIVSGILSEAAVWLRDLGEPLWTPEQVFVDRVAPDCREGLFVLAWDAGRALGTMRLTDADELFWPEASPGEAIYVHRLAVRRVAAGGEVSAALLAHAGETAVARGARYVRLDCESTRQRLRATYERQGFRYHSDRTVRGVHVARYQLAVARPG